MAARKKSKLERLLSFNQHRKRQGAEKSFAQLKGENLNTLKETIIEGDTPSYTHGSSKKLDEHLANLRKEFAGQSELLYYHAKLIVLIRREFKIKQNIALFEALWDQQFEFLLKHLNTRWLVSAADTFIDFSDDPLAKSIAMNVVTLVNTVKLQESERFLQQLENATDDAQRQEILQTKRVPLLDGMSAFAVGTDDTLRNMRWRMDEVAKLHPLGEMLLEVFQRFQQQDTVYKRFRDRHTRAKTAWWDE